MYFTPLNVHKFDQCCQLFFYLEGILDTQYVEKVNKTAIFTGWLNWKLSKVNEISIETEHLWLPYCKQDWKKKCHYF